MNVRLSNNDRKQLAIAIKTDIDQFCVAHYEQDYRDHLGGSVIGEICNRRLVYAFRWMHKEQFNGRMLRLFNRGHTTEDRFFDWLTGIGADIFVLDENGKQFRIPSPNKHFGGSLDGVLKLPERYKLSIPFLTEMKSHNDKSFKSIVKHGVRVSKPKHFAQMAIYGECYNFDYGIYLALNKNDDDIYVEVVEIDKQHGKQLLGKAVNVISAMSLPARIAGTIAYTECKFCPMGGVCHKGDAVDRNCRSCRNSRPLENGGWHCDRWGKEIPHDAIPLGCGEWSVFE